MTITYRVYRRHTAPQLLLLMALGLLLGQPRRACAQAVWELTPYRLHVYLAAEPTPELPQAALDEMGSDLIARVDGEIGAAWDMTVSQPEAPLQRAMLATLEEVGVDAIPTEALEHDKVTLVTISPEVVGFRVSARELDVRTQLFSTVVTKDVYQEALLSDMLFSAVLEAFAPLASIKNGDEDKIELRLRAGRLSTRNASLLAVKPGAVFVPVIRYDDREGKPKKILTLPWSYFLVEDVDQSRLTCKLYSGLHSALAGRRRGRVQQLALAVKPPQKPTRLLLRARTDAERPLVGYDVFLQKPGEKATERQGRTDQNGSILIPPTPDLLRVMYIRNGGQLLAKLPLVPGLEETVTAAVIDDSQRLAAEAIIMAAQEELLDLVTRRAVLIARIQAALKAGKPEEADELLVKLYALKTRDQFTQQLDMEHNKIISDDPLIQRRVDVMFDKIHKQVVQHLDPNEVDKQGVLVREALKAAPAKDSE